MGWAKGVGLLNQGLKLGGVCGWRAVSGFKGRGGRGSTGRPFVFFCSGRVKR